MPLQRLDLRWCRRLVSEQVSELVSERVSELVPVSLVPVTMLVSARTKWLSERVSDLVSVLLSELVSVLAFASLS